MCVCVVGDRKTPADFQLPGVTYLSPDDQVGGYGSDAVQGSELLSNLHCGHSE